MKWTGGNGAWPGFWLFSYRHATNDAYPSVNPVCAQNGEPVSHCYSGELDAFEGQGSQPRGFYGTIHRNSCGCYGVGDQQNGNNYDDTGIDLTADFHTYGMLWTSSTVSWYLDGKLLHSAPAYDSLEQPMYLLLPDVERRLDRAIPTPRLRTRSRPRSTTSACGSSDDPPRATEVHRADARLKPRPPSLVPGCRREDHPICRPRRSLPAAAATSHPTRISARRAGTPRLASASVATTGTTGTGSTGNEYGPQRGEPRRRPSGRVGVRDGLICGFSPTPAPGPTPWPASTGGSDGD
jgi:hypothetical protein